MTEPREPTEEEIEESNDAWERREQLDREACAELEEDFRNHEPKTTMRITPGRIVLYVLNEEDANQINRRRTTGSSIADRIKEEKWPIGAQAHIGNTVNEGTVYPAIAVQVWGEGDDPPVNFQVLLDGNDAYWATSRHESAEPEAGKWHWPPKV